MSKLITAENELNNIFEIIAAQLVPFFNGNEFTPPELKCSGENSKFLWDSKYPFVCEGKMVSGRLLKTKYSEFLKIHLKNQHTGYGELFRIAKLIARCESFTISDFVINPVNTGGASVESKDMPTSVPQKKKSDNELYLLKDLLSMACFMNQSSGITVQPDGQFKIISWDYELSQSALNELKILDGIITFYGMESQSALLKNPFTSSRPTRLVLTPSYSRYKPVSNSWLANSVKCADIWNDTESMNTIHVIVVRPFQTEAYKQHFCQNGFIVASIPENEESVGSARYWCMIIAHALGFHWSFMLDDSFDRQAVRKTAFRNQEGKWEQANSPFASYPVLSGVLLLENLQKKLGEQKCMHVGILSLRRFNRPNSNKRLVTTHFCQGFQLIHVEQVMKNNVYFRRGLHFGEDLLFSQDCCDARLATLMLTYIEYYDHNTNNADIEKSGVHSPNQAVYSHTTDCVQSQLLRSPDNQTLYSIQQTTSSSLDDDPDTVNVLQKQLHNFRMDKTTSDII